jgi:AcrR family transcriptional regulator
MGKESDTKDKILDLAVDLLQDRGYNGFSYSHISEQLGIKNAAVHYHFPSKADLGTALIQRFRAQFASWTAHLQSKYPNQFLKHLDGYIAIPRSFMKREKLVCPLGVLESDFNILPDAMRIETRGLSRDMRRWFTGVLEMGRRQGVFNFSGPAEDKAVMITAALQGASFMASAESQTVFEITVRQIKRDLGVEETADTNTANN